MDEVTNIGAVSWLDWLIVAGYLAVSAIGGLIYAGRQKSEKDYFIGGGTVPGWAAGVSLFANSISTTTVLAFPAQGFSGDLTRLVPGLMLPLVAIYISIFVVPFYRKVVKISAYEYLERRFGYIARAYAALIYIFTQTFRMGFILFLGSKAVHAMTDWSIPGVIALAGLTTLVYTMFGGVKADIWTDVWQASVLLLGAFICLAILAFSPEGGPAHVFQVAAHSEKLKLADFSFDLTQATFLVLALQGIFQYADGYSTGQGGVQRYLCCATTRQAQVGIWVGAISCVVTWSMFMLIGTLLFAYYKIYPAGLPAKIAAEPTEVFPHFLATRLPTGVIGVFLAAMIAAGMSGVNTAINSLSLTSVQDFYKRAWPNIDDKKSLLVSRIFSCFWGLLGIATGISMMRVKAALDLSITVFSILSGGLFGMFMLAFFVRRAHALGAYVGMLAGITVSLWAGLGQLATLGVPLPSMLDNSFPVHVFLTGALSNTVSFAVGFVASLILPDLAKKDATGLVVWDMFQPSTPQLSAHASEMTN